MLLCDKMNVEAPHNEPKSLENTNSLRKITSKSSISENLSAISYNPFTSRRLPHSSLLSDRESFVLLLNIIFGTGIMHMPIGFRRAGNITSFITICVATVICMHCNYLWVKCNHELCYRTHVSCLAYDDVVILTFGHATTWFKKYSVHVRFIIQGMFFLTYFWIGVYYMRIARISIENVIFQDIDTQVHSIIVTCIIIIPIAIMGFIPNLKVLSQFSFISVGLSLCSFLAIFIHMIQELSSEEDETFDDELSGITQCLSLVVFSLQSIGFLLPVENAMENPHHLVQGYYGAGINNITLAFVAIIYAAIGFVGYEKYGTNTCYYILDSIPEEHWMRDIVDFTIGISILSSVSTPLFILYDIAWGIVYNKFLQRPVTASLITRMIVLTMMIFYGSFVGHTTYMFLETFSGITTGIMAIALPAVLDTVLFSSKPHHIPYLEDSSVLTIHSTPKLTEESSWTSRLRQWKNYLIIIFGIIVMISSMYHGLRYFMKESFKTTC